MIALTASPDISLTLITSGILAICLEFLRPGAVLPGVARCMAVLVGIAGLALPSPTGLALLLAGIACLALETLQGVRLRGIPTVAAAILLPLAATRMNPGIHAVVAFPTLSTLALILGYLLSTAARARRNKCVG